MKQFGGKITGNLEFNPTSALLSCVTWAIPVTPHPLPTPEGSGARSCMERPGRPQPELCGPYCSSAFPVLAHPPALVPSPPPAPPRFPFSRQSLPSQKCPSSLERGAPEGLGPQLGALPLQLFLSLARFTSWSSSTRKAVRLG